jgi:hypothetical protein
LLQPAGFCEHPVRVTREAGELIAVAVPALRFGDTGIRALRSRSASPKGGDRNQQHYAETRRTKYIASIGHRAAASAQVTHASHSWKYLVGFGTRVTDMAGNPPQNPKMAGPTGPLARQGH